MDKDSVKGAIDDAAGRATRQAGEGTADVKNQVDGAGQQVRGKVEKALGNMKDAAKEADRERFGEEIEEELDRERTYDSDRP